MNRLLRLILILSCSAPGLVSAMRAAESGTEAEVRQADARRIDALLQRDLAALETLFADELTYIHAGGKIDTKRGYLGMLAGGALTYVTLRYDPAPHVSVVGPDTAVVSGKARIEARNKAGQITERILTTVTVYVRTKGAWHVVSYQGTPVQP